MSEKPYYKNWPENIPKVIDIPEDLSIDQLLRQTAEKFPDAIATTYFGVQMDYKTLDKLVDIIATILVDMGLEKGETVALHFANVPPCIACYYGVLRAGGRVTLLSPLFAKLEAKYQLNDSEAKIFILWEGFLGIDSEIIPQTGVKKVIYSNLGAYFNPDPTIPEDPISTDENQIYLEDLIKKTKPNPPKIEINPKKDLACLQYTGGTTGLPKGAMLTHYNIIANLYQALAWFSEKNVGEEVMMLALPLYHIYAQTVGMHFSVALAANMVLISNPRETEELIEAIENYGITLFPGVAALYNNINNYPHVEKHDFSSIKYCLSGAGPLPKDVQDRFEKLSGAKLREGYGLTEASPVVTANPLDQESKGGTIGLPFPNTDIKIVDLADKTKVLGIGGVGELCVKGPQVMQGYYKKDEENKNTIIDGWLYTGDAAMIRDDGYTVIKERLKNMLKYKGHSVYPAEVEELLYENDKILEVAVIGIPAGPEIGENIKAFVVLKEEFRENTNAEEIIEWAKENMAKYKYPREIEFLEEIPKTNTGKILHRLLREGKYET